MASADDDYMITREEAVRFLQDVLKIPSAETKLKANRVTFLEAMGHHIPYQTIKGISIHPGKRRLPTATDIKTDIMSKMGGLCYQINIFCWMLLRALGFDTYLAPVDALHIKNIHVGVFLNGLTKPNSKHLVEVGLGYPTLQLIPLDSEVSPEYFDSFLRYRFIRQGEDMVIFQHSVKALQNEACESTLPEFINDGWVNFMHMHINQPVSVSHFDSTMTDVFTVVGKIFFLTSLRCVAYPNGRLLCIKDSKLILEDENHQVQVTPFRSRDEVIEAFGRYFPQFPEDMIKAAMENVQINFQEK